MPKYTVQDDTGTTITFDWQGETEPTDSDFEEVFKSAREYVSEKNKPVETPTQESLMEDAGPRILPMLKNLPRSALNLGIDTAKTIANIPGTMKALGKTAAGGIEKLTGLGTGEDIPNWDAFSQSMKDRYGSLGNLYKTMETDPAGFLTDVSTVLGGAGAISKGGALSRAGKATNILYGGGKALGAGLGKAEDVVVGALSGTAVKTVNKARQWSADYQNMLRGRMTGKDMVGRIKDSLNTMADAEGARYAQGLAEIDNAGTMVNPGEIYTRFDGLLDSIRVKRNIDGSLNYTGSNLELQKAMQGELNKINKYLLDRTMGGTPYEMLPSEVDAMKKWIWEEQRKIDPNRNAPVKNVAKQLYGATAHTLEKQVPNYAELTSNYKKYIQWQDEFEKAFSLGDKASMESAINKFRTSAKLDKEFRQQLVTDFKGMTGIDLEAMIAGYDMADLMPRGLWGRSMATGIGLGAYNLNPALWGMLPLTSPHLAGEMMQIQGLGAKYLKKIPSQTGNILYQAGQVRERSKSKSVLYQGGE
jgi:hypothetical protein